jgi:FAD/FMN-containing dehydrogenase
MPDERQVRHVRTLSRRNVLLGAAACTAAAGLSPWSAQALPAEPLKRLRAGFKGTLLTATDAGYAGVRLVNNRIYDRRPALIAACTSSEDVARVLEFARQAALPIAVRSGGHSIAGNSSIDNGVLIDLAPLNQINVDHEQARVSCGAGVRVYQINAAAATAGLALPLGVCGDVGVAGLTLGGGYGWLLSCAGLACGSLLSARAVLSDGRIVQVDDGHEADLMWALRGAGANFAIVTELTFRAQRLPRVLAGQIRLAPEQTEEMLALVNRSAASLPDELTAFGGFVATHGQHHPAISLCWSGDPSQGEAKIRALYASLKPDLGKLRVTTLAEFVGRGDGTDGLSLARYGFAHPLLPTAGLKALASPPATPAGVDYFASLDCMNGAITRPAALNSCAPRIAAGVGASFLVFWEKPETTSAAEQWTEAAWATVQPNTTASYLNMLGEESLTRVRLAYRESFERLRRLKAQFDPDNVLRSNQNIAPQKG